MIRKILCALLLVIGFAEAAVATSKEDPESIDRDAFAVGRRLIPERPGLLQSVVLDYEVYKWSIEPDLDDIRVYDAQQNPVPYAIRRSLPGKSIGGEHVPVPVFRLGAAQVGPPREDATLGAGDYRIDAEVSASGAIVRIRRDREEESGGGPAAGWLIDTSGLRRSIVELDLTLSGNGGDFLSRLRLESSDDLSHFTPVKSDLALVRLEQGGHRIERTRFEIPRTRARYLRLTPIDAALPAELREVRARLAPDRASPKRLRHTIEGRFSPDEPGIVLFDLEAAPPIESVRVLLAEPSSLVEGRLESAASPEGPWRTRQSGVFYFFERGGALRNSAARWTKPRDRYLRLVTSSRGGGLTGEPPTLEIVWRPEQLLYLDRGQSGEPAMLTIGRIDTSDGSFAPAHLLRMGGSAAGELPESTAFLGPEEILAGDAALVRHTPPPWRTYGLWGLLLGSVGIVLTLSLRLMRSADLADSGED